MANPTTSMLPRIRIGLVVGRGRSPYDAPERGCCDHAVVGLGQRHFAADPQQLARVLGLDEGEVRVH
jgi:hypothetical protein